MYIYVCIMIKELRSLKLLGWSVIFVVMVREVVRMFSRSQINVHDFTYQASIHFNPYNSITNKVIKLILDLE